MCYLAYYAEKERVLKKLSHFNHPSFVGGRLPLWMSVSLLIYLLRALLLNAASESFDVLPASRRIRSNNAKDGC